MLRPRARVTLVTLSAAVLLLASSTATVAVKQQDVMIIAHTERGCPTPDQPSDPPSCRFTATGAIDDHGTVVSEPIVVSALGSPVVGTAQWLKTYEGQQGCFTIRLESRVTFVGDSLQAVETGRWVVTGGTGAYAGLIGQGSESGIRDYEAQKLDVTLTGQVH